MDTGVVYQDIDTAEARIYSVDRLCDLHGAGNITVEVISRESPGPNFVQDLVSGSGIAIYDGYGRSPH
ncbi:MAG TPA: hypothetical protein VMT20_14600 [Terriglobia bacterium]|nr:hypothetical protein [Terriglobia bacterium]